MRNTWRNFFCAVLVIIFSMDAIAKDHGAGKHYVFNLVGTGTAYQGMVPSLDGQGEMEADCFDVDLFDLKNQHLIGTATDCLSVQEIIGEAEFIRLIGTTTFNLPQGTLTTQGLTTVAKVMQVTNTPAIGEVTHFTAAAGTDNAILGGTHRFRNATGTARLSGMVNLSELGNGVITFDCIFVIDLD
jgi:hypothetical protein